MEHKSDSIDSENKMEDSLEKCDMETDELDEDSSSDESDDSASEQQLLEAENALKVKVEEIQTSLNAYPYQYQLHVDLLKGYRDLGLYNELRKARELMSEFFPLDQNLWTEWLEDEIKLSSSLEEHEKILELFEKALEDYLSVPLWELYLNFLIEKHDESVSEGLDESKALFSLDAVREKMSKAIHATGYHFSEGSKIWNIILVFEEKQLENEPSEEQIKLLNNMFVARLCVPHPDIESVFTAYSTFVSSHMPSELYEETMKNASALHSNSLQQSLKLGPYEDYLKEYSYAVEAYMEYANFLKAELQQSNQEDKLTWVQFMKSTYERAASQHPLQVSLWEAYISFLYTDFSVNAIVSKVAYRSVRNCPWSGLLWVSYIRSLANGGIDQIEGAFSKAIELGLVKQNCEELVQVLLERCCMLFKELSPITEETKVQLRAIFRNSTDTLYAAFPSGDINWRLLRHWANVEVIQLQDLDAARKVWNEIIKKHKNYSKAWIEYVEFEMKHGSITKARGLLKQGSRTLTDYPESILNFWLDFDRLYGDEKTNQTTFSEIYAAKTRQSDKILQESRKIETAQFLEEAKKERAREKDRANKSRKREKRKRLNSTEDNSNGTTVNNKNSSEQSNLVENTNNEPPKQKRKLDTKNSGPDGSTLYVCNFKDNVDADVLRSLFEKFGTIVQVRRPNTNFAFARRFAYVQFSSQSEANAALTMDGHLLEPDFPLSVKISDPSQRRPRTDNKEKESPSPKRVFISNLPYTISQPSLLAMLQPFGTVKSVRLLTARGGSHNGCAIAEFDLEASGQAALSLNSTQVEGRIISVAIADPAARRSRPEYPPQVESKPAPVQNNYDKKEVKPVQAFKPRQVRINKPHSKINVPRGN